MVGWMIVVLVMLVMVGAAGQRGSDNPQYQWDYARFKGYGEFTNMWNVTDGDKDFLQILTVTLPPPQLKNQPQRTPLIYANSYPLSEDTRLRFNFTEQPMQQLHQNFRQKGYWSYPCKGILIFQENWKLKPDALSSNPAVMYLPEPTEQVPRPGHYKLTGALTNTSWDYHTCQGTMLWVNGMTTNSNPLSRVIYSRNWTVQPRQQYIFQVKMRNLVDPTFDSIPFGQFFCWDCWNPYHNSTTKWFARTPSIPGCLYNSTYSRKFRSRSGQLCFQIRLNNMQTADGNDLVIGDVLMWQLKRQSVKPKTILTASNDTSNVTREEWKDTLVETLGLENGTLYDLKVGMVGEMEGLRRGECRDSVFYKIDGDREVRFLKEGTNVSFMGLVRGVEYMVTARRQCSCYTDYEERTTFTFKEKAKTISISKVVGVDRT